MKFRAVVWPVAALAAAGGFLVSTDLVSQSDNVGSDAGGVDVEQARQQLASLEIGPEHTGGYARDDWPHWEYVGNGCDARQATLKAHAVELEPGKGCAVPGGEWVSQFDGETVTDPSDLDIDHLVPLAEAHASGGHTWDEQRRMEFANDTRYLWPVTASSNRAKGDQDPADWLPDRDVCAYLAVYVAAKAEYQLAVDQAEHAAIDTALDNC